PVPITFLPSDHNLGVLKNYQRGFAACTTEFVAVMEGDDLWTDEHRLQKHVDCLRAHKECPMSFNRFLAANYEQSQFSVNPTIPNPENAPMLYVFGNDLARDNLIGNFSTCVYRTWAVQHIQPSVYKQNAYDWLFHIVLSGHGPIAYLPEVMSVYRVHANGTWSRLSAQERMQNLLDAIERYDAFTGGIYHEAFTEQKSRLSAIRIHELGRLSAPHSFNSRVRRVARACYRYMPPILVKIAKLFISPAAWNKLLSGLARILARIKGRNRNHDA
ncbi:MAG: hypothetical protein PHY12_00810, partial [Eubacteriales bacterium]|nr:hypothetical protein [Eubacteriales bacterium]